MKRSSGMRRRASIAAFRFSTFFSPQPSSCSGGQALGVLGQAEDVGRRLDQAGFQELRHLLLAQALDVEGDARHEVAQPLGELAGADEAAGAAADAPRRRLAHGEAAADAGSGPGSEGLAAPAGPCGTTSTTWGMTSPARWTMTVSPTRTSLRADLVLVVQRRPATMTPPTLTGASSATGVSAPVRPTWIVDVLEHGRACSAANLWAMAQRGARPTKPSRCSRSMRSTL